MESTYASAYRAPQPPRPANASPEEEVTSSGSAVRSFAVRQETNHRFRPYMEDGFKAIDPYLGDPNQALFAIFDGHGGAQAMEYCRNRMHEELKKALNEYPDDVETALRRCFGKVDDQLRLTGAQTTGTTATVCLIRKERGQRLLYVANVGDSRAVLVSASSVTRLSVDHKVSDPSEMERIRSVLHRKQGGFVVMERVGGQLAITRALGDHQLKTSGVSSEPFTSRTALTANEQFLVVASDGLWDVVADQELGSLRNKPSREVAESLLSRAIEGGSRDNICVMAVHF